MPIIKIQIKLSFLIVIFSIISFTTIFLLSKRFTILDSDVTLYTFLFTSIMLTVDCYQGHDLVISRFSPKTLIKIDTLSMIFASSFLIISLYYSLPTLIIISPIIIIFLRRILSISALKINIF